MSNELLVIARRVDHSILSGVNAGVLFVRTPAGEFIVHPIEPVVLDQPTDIGYLSSQIETGREIAMQMGAEFVIEESIPQEKESTVI